MKYLLSLSLISSLVFLASCTSSETPGKGTTASGGTQGKIVAAPAYGSGNHQIEYYADFQCPACIRFSHTLLPILEEFAASGKVMITYKQFPLTQIHKNAYRDSLAAYCAEEQGKFMEYKKELYALEEQKSGASVSDDDRIDATKNLSLDVPKFTQCLGNDTYAASVDRDMADGDAARVNATPTVILDGTKLDMGVFSSEAMFREQMDRILSK